METWIAKTILRFNHLLVKEEWWYSLPHITCNKMVYFRWRWSSFGRLANTTSWSQYNETIVMGRTWGPRKTTETPRGLGLLTGKMVRKSQWEKPNLVPFKWKHQNRIKDNKNNYKLHTLMFRTFSNNKVYCLFVFFSKWNPF